MLRRSFPLLVALSAIGPAVAADMPRRYPRPDARPGVIVVQPDVRAVSPLDGAADLLFTPSEGMIRAIRPRFSAPLLPGSSSLPGYYGSSHSYEYQGPYYGGPYVPYWNRLPYACGVYGYC